MGVVQFSGLASGLDTNAIIEAMLGVERIPMQRLEAQNSDLQNQGSIIDNLSSSLSKLRTKAQALGSTKEFLSFKGTSLDTNIAKLTVGGDAVRGDYKLEVTKLAKSQRNYSEPILDKKASLTEIDTTFSFTLNGETKNIAVKAKSTLEDLVQKINDSGSDVTAGLLYTGASGYRLQFSGTKTGDANKITFSEGGLGLNLAANEAQKAQNAEFEIDDFAISSASNIVTDALPGATVELINTTAAGASTTLSIAPDKDNVKSKLKEFVDAYNGVMTVINAQVGEGKGSNTLNGDATIRSIEQQLSSLMSSPIPDMFDSNGESMALSDLGFETQRNGTLVLNDSKITAALDQSFEGAAKYFSGDGATQGITKLLEKTIKGLVDGKNSMLGSRKDGISARIRSNESRLEGEQKYLDAYEAQLRAQYTVLEQTMAQLQTQGNYLAQFMQ